MYIITSITRYSCNVGRWTRMSGGNSTPVSRRFTYIKHSCIVWVTIGVKFEQDAAIVHSVIDDLPQLAQIDTIYLINGSTLVLKAEYYATTFYVRHLHAYTIASLHKYSFFYHKLSIFPCSFLHQHCQKMPFGAADIHVCIVQALIIANYKHTRSYEYCYKFHDRQKSTY